MDLKLQGHQYEVSKTKDNLRVLSFEHWDLLVHFQEIICIVFKYKEPQMHSSVMGLEFFWGGGSVRVGFFEVSIFTFFIFVSVEITFALKILLG